jgi:alkylhydroperoxidase family enzyme
MLTKQRALGKYNHWLHFDRTSSIPRVRFALAAAAVVCATAGGALEVHYAPQENLEAIDVDLIDRAEHSIDIAATC